MIRVPILDLSRWAHHSWLPRGERVRTERAQAEANASLLACFPDVASNDAMKRLPPFAALPRPACAKVMRVTAALPCTFAAAGSQRVGAQHVCHPDCAARAKRNPARCKGNVRRYRFGCGAECHESRGHDGGRFANCAACDGRPSAMRADRFAHAAARRATRRALSRWRHESSRSRWPARCRLRAGRRKTC